MYYSLYSEVYIRRKILPFLLLFPGRVKILNVTHLTDLHIYKYIHIYECICIHMTFFQAKIKKIYNTNTLTSCFKGKFI